VNEKSVVIVIHAWFPNNQKLIDLLQRYLPYPVCYFTLSDKDRNRVWKAGGDSQVKPVVIPGFLLSFLSRDININPTLPWYLLKVKPAVVITKGWGDPGYFIAQRFARKRNVPFITWMCGRDKNVNPSNLLRKISTAIAKKVIKNSRFVFVYGTRAEMNAIDLGAEKEKVIIVKQVVDDTHFDYRYYSLNDTDRILFRKNLGLSDRPLFLCISQLIPRKGIKDLLKAFAILREKGTDIQLLLIGTGPMKSLVQKYSEDYSQHFVWLSSVPYEKIPFYYLISDYFVFPTHFDAWGNVVNESHWAKLPIICSDGAHSSYDLIKYGYSGLIYKAGDITSLAEMMEYAVKHPTEMKKMAENGYNFVRSEWNLKESVKIWSKYIKLAIEENE